MHFIILIVNYLVRKYGVPLHNFFEFSTRGTSHLKMTFAPSSQKRARSLDSHTICFVVNSYESYVTVLVNHGDSVTYTEASLYCMNVMNGSLVNTTETRKVYKCLEQFNCSITAWIDGPRGILSNVKSKIYELSYK